VAPRGRRSTRRRCPGGDDGSSPRPQVIAFRLASDEALRLTAAAQAAGLSPAAWSRRLVLDQLAGSGSAAGGALAGGPAAAVAPESEPEPRAAAAPPAEPLSRVVGAKLTASQYFDLDARAKAAGVPIGAYLRRLILGQPPTARWPLARKAIVELARVGNNLNQLVKLAHGGTLLPAELHRAVESTLAAVRALRRALLAEPRQ
jgi:hypothetical protein